MHHCKNFDYEKCSNIVNVVHLVLANTENWLVHWLTSQEKWHQKTSLHRKGYFLDAKKILLILTCNSQKTQKHGNNYNSYLSLGLHFQIIMKVHFK